MPDSDPWIEDLIAELELGDLLKRPVEALSGGQQQRVAIARALAHAPEMVFADEPTGNLHDTLSRQVMKMFSRLVAESGSALLMVTHNREMASFAQKQLMLREGHLHAVAENPA
jgi:putative ABC transport system ATP-binding protein